MSVARLKKVSLIGRLSDKDDALTALQDLGVMHLVPLAPEERHLEEVVDRNAEDAYKALRFLDVVPEPRRQVRRSDDFDVHAFVADVLKVKDALRAARDRRAFLQERIKTITPWGEFHLPPAGALRGNLLWFYALPVKERAALAEVNLPWQIVGQDTTTLQLVVVSEDEPASDLLPVPRLHVGDRSLSQLEADLDETEIEIEAVLAERKAMTRYLDLLRADISKEETAAEMAFAQSQTRDDASLFAIQGWVPENCLSKVEDLSEDSGLALLVEDASWDELPPTLLEQPEIEQAGVDLAMFYQVPSYRGWDPTILLVASFSVFFAMIIADAGYGLILTALLLLMWKRLSATSAMRSWRRLGLILAGATVAYGVMVGSYFGAPPPYTGLQRLAVLDLNDFSTMMRLSIIVGVAHIAFAQSMAFRANPRRSRFASLAWIGILIGGLMIWLSGQTGGAFLIGALIAIAGVVGLVFFTSDRPIDKPIDWAWRIFDGVKKLSGLMGLFGDVLSYMRLFALGLASASLALTFNDLAGQVMGSGSGLAILGGLLILLIGHLLNFGLALMSGVVHGLRLNYIEFYKWGLPEEGTAFRAFSRKEVQQ